MRKLERNEAKILKELGKTISGICSKKGRSLERVAYEAGISKSYIYDIANGKANFVFVDMAFLGRDSPKAAQATYCAEEQEMYWEYHDMLYTLQEDKIDGGWANSERLKAIALDLGLDPDLFEGCLDSGKYSKRVQYNTQQARDHNVRGTPNFIVVGPDGQQQLGGAQPFSVFKQVLDKMI